MPHRPCVEMTKLDISNNQVSTLKPIGVASLLPPAALPVVLGADGTPRLDVFDPLTVLARLAVDNLRELTFLKATGNRVRSLNGLQECQRLTVINLGNNYIENTSHVHGVQSVKALILNNNKLRHIDGIGKLKNLNSLGAHRRRPDVPDGCSGVLRVITGQFSHLPPSNS